MYCKECGSKVNDNAKFCPNCGNSMEKQEEVLADKPIENQTPDNIVESETDESRKISKEIVEETETIKPISEKRVTGKSEKIQSIPEKTDTKAMEKMLKKPKKWKYILSIILICGLWGWLMNKTAMEQTLPLKDFFIRAGVVSGVLILIWIKYIFSFFMYTRRKAKDTAAITIVICVALLFIAGFPDAMAQEQHIEEMINIGSLQLPMILDRQNYEIEAQKIFRFNNYEYKSRDGIRNMYIYQCENILTKNGVRLNVSIHRCLDKEEAENYFNEYIEENKPDDYIRAETPDNPLIGSRRERDPASFMNINYDSNIIKQTDSEFFAFNHDELIREWYPGSGAVAPMTSTVTIRAVNKKTPGIFDYDETKDGDAGEDEIGPFIYGETYDQAGASCEMQYAFFVKDNIFAVVSAYGSGGVRKPENQLTKEHVQKMINDLTAKVQPIVESTKEEIENNFNKIDLDKEGLITGHAATFKPVVNAKMELTLKDGSKYETISDQSGNFVFDTGKSNDELLKTGSGEITVLLSYNTYKENFRIVYGDEIIRIGNKFEFETKKDLNITALFKEPEDLSGNVPIGNSNDLYMVTAFYIHTAEAYEFYRDILGADVSKDRDNNKPITIFVMGEGKSAYYSGADENIYIPMARAPFNHPNRPMNREWHEFSHLAQEAIYGKFPEGYAPEEMTSIKNDNDIKTTYSRNHKGFKNNSTADSFIEGFAEFIPLVMAKHLGYPDYYVYPVGGSLETNRVSLKVEELAVAGILWDLVDSDDDYKNGVDDDKAIIPFEEIWGILKTYKNNFTEVHDALTDKYGGNSDLKNAIDTIFLRHGFFSFSTPGNGTRQGYEPYFDGVMRVGADSSKKGYDVSADNKYGLGEEFIDFPSPVRYQPGDEIGSPSDMERTFRKEAVIPEGYYVHPGKCENDYYYVYVEFPEIPYYRYGMKTAVTEEGLVPVPFPPEEYKATIQITSGAGEPLKIENSDFHASYEKALEQGYYIKYDFETTENEEYLIPETDIKPVNYETGYNIPFYDMVELAQEQDRSYQAIKDEYGDKNSENADKVTAVSAGGNGRKTEKTEKTGPAETKGIKGLLIKTGYMTVYAIPVIIGLFIIIMIIRKKEKK